MVGRHFTVTGIVLDDQNRALLVKHRKLGVWLPPGGHIEPDELPEDAAVREVYEETGVRAELVPGNGAVFDDERVRTLPMPMTMLLEDIEGDGRHFHIDMVFRMRALTHEARPCEGENTAVGWFHGHELGIVEFDNVRAVIVHAMAMRW